MLWKRSYEEKKESVSLSELEDLFFKSPCLLLAVLSSLKRKKYIERCGKESYRLTAVGMLWARKVVRLHRLWELYLVTYLDIAKDKVHPIAEEMEHIITPEIEHELDYLLEHPETDPHSMPIPMKEERLLSGSQETSERLAECS